MALIPDEKVRAYIYRVLVGVAPIVVLYGAATESEVALYLSAAATILGVGLAAANTSTKA